jgi:hypothetical protein
MNKNKRSLSAFARPADYGIEPEDNPYAQALAELVAMGVIEAKGVKFEGGKWQTLWGLTDFGIKHGQSCIDEFIAKEKRPKQ